MANEDTQKSIKASFVELKRRKQLPWQGEEEVRMGWCKAIEDCLGIILHAERDRNDLSYNNVVIEFKAPNYFGGKKNSPKFQEAINDRLLPYIKRKAKSEGRKQEDYIGIAIDGAHICFANVADNKIQHGHLLEFSESSFEHVIDAIKSNYRRALSADNLIEDFGHQSIIGMNFMQSLSDCLKHSLGCGNTKINMMFSEWRNMYGQVADLSFEQKRELGNQLNFIWNGDSNISIPARLFVIHTYNSFLIKALAAEIVASHGLCGNGNPAENYAFLVNDSELIPTIDRDIEKCGLFESACIRGFVEEAIFSWYLDAGSKNEKDNLVESIRRLFSKLSIYIMNKLDRTRDVLRDFYQNLVPDVLRKSLGEFYTPDWLVDFTLSKSQANWSECRFLDPTCGSGAFLIAAIRKKINAIKLPATKKIDAIIQSVVGFDLNPLAVQTARLNYLMEISELLAECSGKPIEIPVLLADSVYSPATVPKSKDEIVEYSIGSNVASLKIQLPSDLAIDRLFLDCVLESLGADVMNDCDFNAAKSNLIDSCLQSEEKNEEWWKPIEFTYNQILNLHKKNWNGIWFRIVRNFFLSANMGQFDVVAGNPPWVRWSKLPPAYRDRVKPTCEQYDIFSQTPHHGGNELDISAMITYTVADKWLKSQGELLFIVTQTNFQSPSSSGFRNFKISDNAYLIPISVDDLQNLKPFPDALNKTAVAHFIKGNQQVKYPIPYFTWDTKSGFPRAISPTQNLEEVKNRTEITRKEATPVDGLGSPWAILPPGRFGIIQKLSGKSTWINGRKGITCDLNTVYFVNVISYNETNNLVQIRNQATNGKIDIGPQHTAWIEPELLFPLIKGASDFAAFEIKASPDLYAIIPNFGINKSEYAAAVSTVNATKYLKKYLAKYKSFLENRSTFMTRMVNAPYYAIYNVGEYSFSKYKVIWAEMSGKFVSAVASSRSGIFHKNKVFVPDHKIFFVDMDDEYTAHYLCGILNSRLIAEYIESHIIKIQIGNIFKHMNIPNYSKSDPKHKHLAELSISAHQSKGALKAKAINDCKDYADNLLQEWFKK